MNSKTMKVDLVDGQLRLNGESPEPGNNDGDFSQLDQMLLGDDEGIINRKSAQTMAIIQEQSEKNDSGSDIEDSDRKVTETVPFNQDFTKSELWVLNQEPQNNETQGSNDEERALFLN